MNATPAFRVRVYYGLIVALFFAALALRVQGIATEKLWFDEAASVELSQGGMRAMVRASANDSTPPLYFLGLGCWRMIFGGTDPALRAYSVFWSMAGLALVFGFARRVGGRRTAAVALALLAVSPIDVYFAGEVRMYAQGATLGVATVWLLWEWLQTPPDSTRRHWTGAAYGAACLALLLTHYVCIAVLVAQAAFMVLACARRRQLRRLFEYAAWCSAAACLFAAWYGYVFSLRGGFNAGNFSWMRPPPPMFYVNYLWHEFFWGRNGAAQKHAWGWGLAAALVVIASGAVAAWRRRLPAGVPLFAAMIFVPPLIAGVLGHLYQTMYNRERFATFLAPFFALAAASLLTAFKTRAVSLGSIGLLSALMLTGTLWQHCVVSRPDWGQFVSLWKQNSPETVVFFPSHNDLPASRYVSRRLISPHSQQFDAMLPALAGKRIWAAASKDHPLRQPGPEHDYYRRVMSCGTPENVYFASNHKITELTVGKYSIPLEFQDRFSIWSEPEDQFQRTNGFNDPKVFHEIQTEPQGSRVRWSMSPAWFRLHPREDSATATLQFEWPPLSAGMDAQFFAARTQSPDELFAKLPVETVASPGIPGIQHIDLPLPAGRGPVLIGWKSGVVNLKRAGVSGDDRDLGLLVRWVGILK